MGASGMRSPWLWSFSNTLPTRNTQVFRPSWAASSFGEGSFRNCGPFPSPQTRNGKCLFRALDRDGWTAGRTVHQDIPAHDTRGAQSHPQLP